MTSPAAAPHAPPAWALALGYAGVLPFVACAATVVAAGDAGLRASAGFALAGYGAVIVAFLGGIHWGIGFARALSTPATYVWGVLPSLVAWAALWWSGRGGLVLLAATLLVCYAVDHRAYPRHGLGAWLPLRRHLTAFAAVSCGVGAAWW